MNITFRQGIISYPNSGGMQQFLKKSGKYVSLDATSGNTYVAVAHGSSNYLLVENTSTASAWGPFESGTTAWLYWNLNTTTAVKSYGYTTIAPTHGTTAPTSPAKGSHWFDTTARQMKVWGGSSWQVVIRVFAAKYTDAGLAALGSDLKNSFAGSQVGLSNTSISIGEILADSSGKPVRKSSGEFFTLTDDFFVNGSPITTLKLDAVALTREAGATVGQYNVVILQSDGKVSPADYNDVGTLPVGIATVGGVAGDAITFAVQGVIHNNAWNWSTIGTKLYVSSGGDLTDVDPHTTDAVSNPTNKQPVGYVLSETEIYFDQGLGGKGEKGDAGSGVAEPASIAAAGVVRLTTTAVDPTDPVAVAATDPRLTNARAPLVHSQHADTITVNPLVNVSGDTLDVQLSSIDGAITNTTQTLSSLSDNVTGITSTVSDVQTAVDQKIDKTPILESVAALPVASPGLMMVTGTGDAATVTTATIVGDGAVTVSQPDANNNITVSVDTSSFMVGAPLVNSGTLTVPENMLVGMYMNLTNDGTIVLDGYLIDVL